MPEMNQGMMEFQPASPTVQYVGEPPRRGLLDKPNAELLTSNDLLQLMREYTRTMRGPRKDDPEIAKKAWNAFSGFINAQASLTFYTPKIIPRWDVDFDIAWNNFIMSLRPGELTQDIRLFKENLKQHAWAILHRSIGVQGNVTNERTSQAMSIIHHINTASGMGGRPGGGSGGFLNNLRSLFK